jgi:hypothetical protein
MHATALPSTVIDTPVPLHRPTCVLTPRGHCAVEVIRLGYELRDLDGEDRAYCLDLVRELIEEVTA